MAIQPGILLPHYDAIEKSRSRLVAVAHIPNRAGDAATLNANVPVAIGAGGSFRTGVIIVTGFNTFTVLFGAAGANPCRLIYEVINPADATTTLTEVVVGDNAADSTIRPFSWSNAGVASATVPAVHHLIKLKFTGVGGATSLNTLFGLWMAAS